MNGLALLPIKLISELFQDFLDLLFPPVCGLCGQKADTPDRLVCQQCLDKIPGLPDPYCSHCRIVLGESSTCPDCRNSSFPVFTLGPYNESLKQLVHDLKFAGLKPLGPLMGRKIAGLISDRKISLYFDYIIPIPLYPGRFYKRGYNQSEEIARGVSESLNVELLTDILYMSHKTRQQARLPAYKRISNIKDAFSVDDSIQLEDKSVLLIDDVTTTGETLKEAARVLLEAGVSRIVAATIATTF